MQTCTHLLVSRESNTGTEECHLLVFCTEVWEKLGKLSIQCLEEKKYSKEGMMIFKEQSMNEISLTTRLSPKVLLL